MAVQQLQLPGNYGAGPNNLVDQSQWSQLANLGNVYQKGQEQARQQTALASLGQDPAANAKALIGSGVPSLVELGMNAQNQQQAQAIRQAQEKRAQQTFDEDSPTGRIAKLKDAGINPADPAYRPYIVTGQNLPTGAADFTVEKVTNTDGTTSLVRVKKSGPEGPIDVGGAGAKPAIDPNITGDDYLAQLDPARANTIKAIAEGRQAPPTGYALRSPQVQSLLRDVAQYEPGFDLTLWKSRNNMLTSATSGKVGQNIASFNTAIGHLDALDKSIGGLENTSYPKINAVANAAREQYDPEFAGRLKQFQAAKTAVVDELTRAFRGTGGNVHDLVEWGNTINSADSPQALQAATKQVVDLLRSRIDALGDQYNRGMQTKVMKEPLDLLSPKAKGTIQRLSGEPLAEAPAGGPVPGPAGAPTTAPVLGPGGPGPVQAGMLAPAPTPAPVAAPVRITTPAEYHALASGTPYIDPEGRQRTKR